MSTEADHYVWNEIQQEPDHIYFYQHDDPRLGDGGLDTDAFFGVTVYPVTSNTDIYYHGQHWHTGPDGTRSWGIRVQILGPSPMIAPVELRFHAVRIPTVG